MRKVLAAAVAAAVLAAGGVAFALFNPLASVGAQDPPAPTTPARPAPPEGRHGRRQVLEETLAELVQKGTLTQAQADAVKEAVKAKLPKGPVRGQGGVGQAGHGFLREALKTAAETIGISPTDLAAEIRSGKSLADVATEKGVDPQKVIDALAAKGREAVDQAVQSGRLTTEQADKIKGKLGDLAQRLVNHKGGEGVSGRGGRRFGGPDASGPLGGNAPTAPLGSEPNQLGPNSSGPTPTSTTEPTTAPPGPLTHS